MDKSNIAFALITAILGIYISVALLLSRVRESRTHKPQEAPRRLSTDDADQHRRSGTWTSYSS
jgi:hypothetical protein